MTQAQVKIPTSSSLALFLRDIKIEHSLFALPFAAASLLYVDVTKISIAQAVFLLLCMIAARSFAMGANRIIDRRIDRENPRTKERLIAKGVLSPKKALLWTLAFAFLFIFSAYSLCPLAGYLSVPVLAILAIYPFLKRVSFLCHWYLGFCLGLSVLAVEVAMTEKISLPFLSLALAITLWTAGFDLVYATLDIEFDRKAKLHSFAAHFGQSRALLLSKICFSLALCFLALAGFLLKNGFLYYIGLGFVGFLLAWIHYSINPQAIASKTTTLAFQGINTWVGPCFLLFACLDRFFS